MACYWSERAPVAWENQHTQPTGRVLCSLQLTLNSRCELMHMTTPECGRNWLVCVCWVRNRVSHDSDYGIETPAMFQGIIRRRAHWLIEPLRPTTLVWSCLRQSPSDTWILTFSHACPWSTDLTWWRWSASTSPKSYKLALLTSLRAGCVPK